MKIKASENLDDRAKDQHTVTASLQALKYAGKGPPPKLGHPNSWQTIYPKEGKGWNP